MNLRDLKYLVTLVDYGHFGKAAEACFVSQPALSMQIKKLEESLGVPLIERTNKTFLLTETGKKIVAHARTILLDVDAMYETAKQAKDPFSGELRLGVIPTLAPYLLPSIIPGIHKTFPKLTLYLIEQQTQVLLQAMEHGKIDAALLALPIAGAEIKSKALFEEEFMLALPRQHPLAKHKIAKLAYLADESLLLLEDGHCLRDQALAICHRSHAKEAKSFQATSLETLRYMVASNVGMTLMPKLSCRHDNGIIYLPFANPKPGRKIGLVWRTSSTKKILLDQLILSISKLLTKRSTEIKIV